MGPVEPGQGVGAGCDVGMSLLQGFPAQIQAFLEKGLGIRVKPQTGEDAADDLHQSALKSGLVRKLGSDPLCASVQNLPCRDGVPQGF